MPEKISDAELNAVWQIIEDNLGIGREDVAVVVLSDGTIKADCMLLEKIPEHSLRRMMDGRLYEEDGQKVYVEATGVEEHQNVIFDVTKVR